MSVFRKNCITAAIAVGVLLSNGSLAQVIYVKPSASGADNGSSWTDAFTCLHTALDSAAEYDELWVAAGTYKPVHSYNSGWDKRYNHFRLKRSVALYGGFAGTETARNQRSSDPALTILSGDLNGNDNGNLSPTEPTRSDNCYHVINNPAYLALEDTILDGFTIQGGNASYAADSNFASGGGLLSYNYYPLTINNCVFSQNTAVSYGGGIYLYGTNVNAIPITITNSTFVNNYADSGGGLYIKSGRNKVANCIFANNAATVGGGIFNNQCDPAISDCSFMDNAAQRGGGMFNMGSSLNPSPSPTITRCLFSGNYVIYNSAVYSGGGGIYNQSCSPKITDCIFENNQAQPGTLVSTAGGGIYNLESNPGITGCIFTDNIADYGGGMVNIGASPSITNCTFRRNCATSIYDGGGAIASYDQRYWAYSWITIFPIPTEPIITHCLFEDNTAIGGVSGGIGHLTGQLYFSGGAINKAKEVSYCTFNRNSARYGGAICTAQIVNSCVFNENTAEYGGAVHSVQTITHSSFNDNSATRDGGAVYLIDNAVTLERCSFTGNSVVRTANDCAGGAVLTLANRTTISDCSFIQNTLVGPGNAYGGAVYSFYDLSVVNSVFAANTACGSSAYGGGLFVNAQSSNIVNCTLIANAACGASNSVGGAIVFPDKAASVITNSILWNNTAANGPQIPAFNNAAVTYNIIQGGHPSGENLDADPFFVRNPAPGPDGLWATEDDDCGDLRLQPNSPAVDTGTNFAVDPNTLSDRICSARILDGNCDGQPVVDIGAYEYFLPGDLNTSCTVDFEDMTLFLPHWLEQNCPNPDNCAQADIDRSGKVDLADWAILASNWLSGI